MFFMENENGKETTVNDLVQEAAEKNKETSQQQLGENNQEENKAEVKVDTSETKDDLVEDKNQQQQSEVKDVKTEEKPDVSYDALLKELGVDSLDALKERLKAPKQEEIVSPEEKERRDNVYRANLQTFAVENGVMKMDDFHKMEAIKNKSDRDLVYESWLPTWKEENPDVEKEDVDSLAKEAFEDEFKINSENEKTKARGESKLAKEAKEIRSPLESSFNKIKTEYDNTLDVRATFPAYAKKVEGFVSESIPNEFNVFSDKDGEENISVKVPLTDEDKKEILENVSKKIQSNTTFDQYKKGDFKSIQDLAKKETENYIWEKKREDGLREVAKTFLGRGAAKGSTVGATAPFHMQQENGGIAKKSRQDAEAEVLESLKGK